MNYKYITLLILIVCLNTQAQTTKKLNLKPFKLQFSFVSQPKNNLEFKLNNQLINTHYFSVYNKTLKSNDYYVTDGINYKFMSTRNILKNEYELYKIDSFNPYGSSSFEKAVFLGVLHTIFPKL